MNPIFLGVDVAGASNTWVCGLSLTTTGLSIHLPPAKQTLADIVNYAEQNNVVAVAIDAPLTNSINDENGFRSSDMQLRDLLPVKYRNWVASQNSLMSVPVRGRQLAEALSPIVGTIIETHPRACLYFVNPADESLTGYKGKDGTVHSRKLWNHWADKFNINSYSTLSDISDGALDSLVCATIAYLYHREPDKLFKLNYGATNKTGRGPFYVLNPQ